MAYLTYGEFTGYGGRVDESAFQLLEFQARQVIDALTHGRVKGDTQVREAVKFAAYALITAMASDAASDNKIVQGMSNDGVSITYSPQLTLAARYSEIAYPLLMNDLTTEGVPIVYAGVGV